MEKHMTPIHLENYDVLGKLAKWADESPKKRQRSIEIRTERFGFGERITWIVTLHWLGTDQMLYNIRQAAPSIQEAVELAFRQFDSCNRNGDHN